MECVSGSGARTFLELGRSWHTATLHAAYCVSVRAAGARRAFDRRMFGKRLNSLLGAACYGEHVRESEAGKEARGWFLPRAEVLEALLRR